MVYDTPEDLMKLARNFMESRILFSGAELNIFTTLNQRSLTAQELSDKLHTGKRATIILLDALAAMGLLVKSDEAYQCAPSLAPYLSEGENSILPMILHAAHLWHRWSRLTDLVEGKSKAITDKPSFFSGHELKAFIGAMHAVSAPHAGEIVKEINPGSAKALLDVGGASGTYTIAFLKVAPEMKATLFDKPEVIEMARERLEKEGMLNRVSLASGDYNQDNFPEGHDLAFLSAIIHSNGYERNLDLYKKVFRSLMPGGRIVIRDHVMEEDRIHPKEGAIFAVNMLVATEGGKTYTFEEISTGLAEAGFHNIRLFKKSDRMDAIVEAFKP